MVINFLKVAADYVNIWIFKKSSSYCLTLTFWEWVTFFLCVIPTLITLGNILYYYNSNLIKCPRTFGKYQFQFCECDLIERKFHIEHQTSDYEMNSLCNTRYGTDVMYVNSSILFTQYLPKTLLSGAPGMSYFKTKKGKCFIIMI